MSGQLANAVKGRSFRRAPAAGVTKQGRVRSNDRQGMEMPSA